MLNTEWKRRNSRNSINTSITNTKRHTAENEQNQTEDGIMEEDTCVSSIFSGFLEGISKNKWNVLNAYTGQLRRCT